VWWLVVVVVVLQDGRRGVAGEREGLSAADADVTMFGWSAWLVASGQKWFIVT